MKCSYLYSWSLVFVIQKLWRNIFKIRHSLVIVKSYGRGAFALSHLLPDGAEILLRKTFISVFGSFYRSAFAGNFFDQLLHSFYLLFVLIFICSNFLFYPVKKRLETVIQKPKLVNKFRLLIYSRIEFCLSLFVHTGEYFSLFLILLFDFSENIDFLGKTFFQHIKTCWYHFLLLI